jgi:hypothetical protein
MKQQVYYDASNEVFLSNMERPSGNHLKSTFTRKLYEGPAVCFRTLLGSLCDAINCPGHANTKPDEVISAAKFLLSKANGDQDFHKTRITRLVKQIADLESGIHFKPLAAC